MDPNTNQQQGAQTSDPVAQNAVSPAVQGVVAPAEEMGDIPEELLKVPDGVQATPEQKSPVFSQGNAQNTDTPEWLKDASDKASSDKIAEVPLEAERVEEVPAVEPPTEEAEAASTVESSAEVSAEASVETPEEAPVQQDSSPVQLRAEKPTTTELGQNPSSLIEVKPSLEVVKKADAEAAEKLEAAGYDSRTGKKVEDGEGAAEPVDAPKPAKKSFFASLFPFFGKKKAATGSAGEKTIYPKDPNAKEKQKFMEAEKIYEEGLASIKDLISPSSMEIQYDSLKIDGVYAKSFYVFAYPRYLEANWLAPVINFDVTMDISQFIYPIGSGDIMKTLKKKVAQMQSSMRINSEKGKVRDPALETALEDAEVLRTEIQRGQEKFFQFALYFTIYAKSAKKLEKVSKQLESLLSGKLVMTKRTQLQSEHGLNSCLPMCLDELYTIRDMNTSPLSTCFPFTSSDLTSDRGILYGINRHNDSLVIFDRFALENANSVVFAKSGAGKSYAVKLEILRLMMMGTDVIVIDPENEYEALANTVGGSYLRLSLNSDRRINPFDLPKPIKGEEVQPGDILRSNIISLQGLLKVMLGEMTPEEESLLDKALLDSYALKGITMETVDPSNFEPPTMRDLEQILGSMDGANSLVQRLSKFTTGSYAGIFNQPTNIDLTSGLMIFCIRDLEDALRPIAMYIILNYIWARVRSELKKRILVIDEAWTMMQHEDSAKFLFGLVKRARKYYLGVTTITQDVDDFVKSAYGKPIVTNSSMQLLLKQAPSSVDLLGKTFNLTEGEKYVLLNSGVGQGLFFAGNKHVAIQVIASYTEDKIVTTNPEELLKEQEVLEAEQEE